jgi:hypothetical protein
MPRPNPGQKHFKGFTPFAILALIKAMQGIPGLELTEPPISDVMRIIGQVDVMS